MIVDEQLQEWVEILDNYDDVKELEENSRLNELDSILEKRYHTPATESRYEAYTRILAIQQKGVDILVKAKNGHYYKTRYIFGADKDEEAMRDHDVVKAFPQGGGFSCTIPRIDIIEWDAEFPAVYREQEFCLDFCGDIEEEPHWTGYHVPQRRWNGWACPNFKYEEAVKILETFKEMSQGTFTFWYEEDKDRFCWKDEWQEYDEEYPHDEGNGFDICVNDESIHVYDIGAGYYTWDEWELPEEEEE